jgi:hypothetical protein
MIWEPICLNKKKKSHGLVFFCWIDRGGGGFIIVSCKIMSSRKPIIEKRKRRRKKKGKKKKKKRRQSVCKLSMSDFFTQYGPLVQFWQLSMTSGFSPYALQFQVHQQHHYWVVFQTRASSIMRVVVLRFFLT